MRKVRVVNTDRRRRSVSLINYVDALAGADFVRTYKAPFTKFCHKAGYPNFRCQRSYDERIIRDDAELNRTRQHIIDIPTHWNQDERHAR